MRRALVKVNNTKAGILEEVVQNKEYRFYYFDEYQAGSVSLTMPICDKEYQFDGFPPFFDGLLPEGVQLEALLKQRKIDRDDLFSQLVAVGEDLVGNVTVEESV